MANQPVSTGPHPSASLYVGDLQTDVTEAQLFEIFNAVGPVASVRVCRDAATRRSLGYAYVNFHRVEDAERALDTMNFKQIKNQACRIMWSHRDPSLRKSGVGNIFVKHLAKNIDNKTLYDTFSMFGNILSCKVAMNANRESLGYGFVHYESEEHAQSAISRVNNKVIAGQQVTVSKFLSKKERYKNGGGPDVFTNVFVKNIPVDFDEEKLRALADDYGTIESLFLGPVKEHQKFGNARYGFVNFATPEEAKAALEGLNGKDVGDPEKKLFAAKAQKKKDRETQLRERFEEHRRLTQRKYAGVNLYVKNLSDDIDEAKLASEFAKFGAITSCRVMTDNDGKSRGFGFVCFSTQEEATEAVTKMKSAMLNNKPLYVALAQRRDVRRAQLQAQYEARQASKMAGVPQQMFNGQPILYQPGNPAYMRGGFYPQMMPRGGQFAPGGMMGGPGRNYQLVPIAGGRGQPQGGQSAGPRRPGGNGARRGGGKGMQRPQGQRGGAQNPGFKFAENAQNVRPQPAATQQRPEAQEPDEGQLTIQQLAAAPDEQKKQMIGERLFPRVAEVEEHLAGKITGMLLEMDNGELIHLLENNEALEEKIREAVEVLKAHGDAE